MGNKQIIRNFGWRRDVPDNRDKIYKLARNFKVTQLPPIVELRPYCSAVENQMSLGSCTAQALCGNVEFLDKKADGEYTDKSRLFVYYLEREIEGNITEDAGAMLRTGIKALARWGVCKEELWQYNINKFAEKPPKECYTDAKSGIISDYQRLNTLNDMLSCLAKGFPFVFGITLYESFMSEKTRNTGIVEMPKANDGVIGGHAVMAVGYNLKNKTFKVRNSWGSWGQEGYFDLPFEYLMTLGADVWTIKK